MAAQVGLYRLQDSDPPHLVLRVGHLASLVVLFMALGALRDGLFAPLGRVVRSVPSATVGGCSQHFDPGCWVLAM